MNHLERLANYLPGEVVVVLIAALPVVELRGAIPFAQGVLGMDPLTALFWSLLGNILAVLLLLKLLGPVSHFLSKRIILCRNIFDWVFTRTRRRSKVVEKYGYLGLIILVAVPLPMTGGWTGSIVAFLLGINFMRAMPAITVGLVLAGVVVTLAVTGVLTAIRAFI